MFDQFPGLNKQFDLLDTHQARVKLVLFCGAFGCLFLNVFHPFNIDFWFPKVKAPMFIILSFFSVAGTAALALSQFAIRALFKIKTTTRLGFIAWLILEFFLISIAIHCVNIYLLELSFFDGHEYLITLKYTLMTLVLPYLLALVLLYIEQQSKMVQELTIQINKTKSTDSITILDENGKVAVSLPIKNILYFKSEDNYILLYYKSDGESKKELIRTNLKKLEQDLNLPYFLRIHRSYMINCQNLQSAVRTAKGYMVKLEGNAEGPLQVSATYQSVFEERVIKSA